MGKEPGYKTWACWVCGAKGRGDRPDDHARSDIHVAESRRYGVCVECCTNGKHGPTCSIGAAEREPEPAMIGLDATLRERERLKNTRTVFIQAGAKSVPEGLEQGTEIRASDFRPGDRLPGTDLVCVGYEPPPPTSCPSFPTPGTFTLKPGDVYSFPVGREHPPTAAGRLENAKRLIDEGRITREEFVALLDAPLSEDEQAQDKALDESDKAIDELEAKIAAHEATGAAILERLVSGYPAPPTAKPVLLVPAHVHADLVRELGKLREADEKAERFGEALDRALPPSMAPRPGERCKVCGEAVPMVQAGGGFGCGPGSIPRPIGWMLLAYPYKSGMSPNEWLRLCPKCGERVASYINYCCANPHERSGE